MKIINFHGKSCNIQCVCICMHVCMCKCMHPCKTCLYFHKFIRFIRTFAWTSLLYDLFCNYWIINLNILSTIKTQKKKMKRNWKRVCKWSHLWVLQPLNVLFRIIIQVYIIAFVNLIKGVSKCGRGRHPNSDILEFWRFLEVVE